MDEHKLIFSLRVWYRDTSMLLKRNGCNVLETHEPCLRIVVPKVLWCVVLFRWFEGAAAAKALESCAAVTTGL